MATKYQDVVQDRAGNAIADAVVKVYGAGTLVLSTIYSDDGITPINQTTAPVTTDADGDFEFYAAPGTYDIAVTSPGFSTVTMTGVVISAPSTGTNTGDNATNSQYSGLVSNATHTGDVTGATALTITNGAVTYAKMQNVSATDKLLGRSTSDAGDVEEIACTAAGRALLDDVDSAAQRVTLDAASATDLASIANGKGSALVESSQYGMQPPGGTAIVEKGFWADTGAGANIWRVKDRFLVGDATEQDGNKSPTERTWVGESASGFMTYFDSRSQAAFFSSKGAVGGAFASRSSDNVEAGELNTMAGGFFALNDNTNAADKKSAWALYAHAAQTQANAFTAALELDACSTVTLVAVDPYLMGATGSTATAWIGVGGETAQGLQAGGQGATLTNVSCALGIINSESAAAGNRYAKGVVFAANAIAGTDGVTGTAEAVLMAKGHELAWNYASGVRGANIRSDVSASTGRQGILFQNAATWITSNDQITGTIEDAAAGAAVNYARLMAVATGTDPQILAGGGGTNLSMVVCGKGSGGGVLKDGAGNIRVQTNTTGVGFQTSAPIAKPTITGSRGGIAALGSLLDELANYGLIANGTSA